VIVVSSCSKRYFTLTELTVGELTVKVRLASLERSQGTTYEASAVPSACQNKAETTDIGR